MDQTMNQSSSKWSKDQAIPHTPRDDAILIELALKTKYMETSQICKKFWGETRGCLKACQRRLRQLEAYGLIRRIEQAARRSEGRKQDLFTLDHKSIPLLVKLGVNPKLIDLRAWSNEELNPQIYHLLEITNAQICWAAACRACAISVETWLTEKEIRLQYTAEAGLFVDATGHTQRKPIADAFTILQRDADSRRACYWLEIDRSNINLHTCFQKRPSIEGKLSKFIDWEASEQFVQEFGHRPLRKLFITRGDGRLHNMLLVTKQVITQRVEAQIHLSEEQKQGAMQRLAKRFLFTTFARFYAQNPLTQPIWYMATLDTPRVLLE